MFNSFVFKAEAEAASCCSLLHLVPVSNDQSFDRKRIKIETPTQKSGAERRRQRQQQVDSYAKLSDRCLCNESVGWSVHWTDPFFVVTVVSSSTLRFFLFVLRVDSFSRWQTQTVVCVCVFIYRIIAAFSEG